MLKLGKRDPKWHPNTLNILKYHPALFSTPVAPPPEKRAWEYSVHDSAWAATMLGNDEVGDCVIAAWLHYKMAALANAGRPWTLPTTEEALALYSTVTGYNPADPSTDQGTVWTDMLAYLQKNGDILGWASIPLNLNALRNALQTFGGVLIGTPIYQSMEDQFGSGQAWNGPFSGNLLGGHGIPILGYGSEGETCITWGARQQMDLTAPSLFDEMYCVVTNDFMDAAGKSPSGLNINALWADLKAQANA